MRSRIILSLVLLSLGVSSAFNALLPLRQVYRALIEPVRVLDHQIILSIYSRVAVYYYLVALICLCVMLLGYVLVWRVRWVIYSFIPGLIASVLIWIILFLGSYDTSYAGLHRVTWLASFFAWTLISLFIYVLMMCIRCRRAFVDWQEEQQNLSWRE